ncbi:MAG TPA: AGE family epimerase/isomerase [Opitutaceae bacterium]|nr:AGE family epimerase/isomerase [Opitutaceae bacterium]
MRSSLLVFAITAGLILPFEALTCGATTGPRAPAATSSPAQGALSAREREALRELGRRAETELRGEILPFWLMHVRDRERGGFFGRIDNDLDVDKGEPRGSLLTSRILWTFSAAHRRYSTWDYREMARWAFADLQQRFWDNEHGGVIWSTKANGKPLELRKQTYAQAFAIYGCAEYFRATNERAALDRAIEIYRLLESHVYDRAQGGYFEAMGRDWNPLPPEAGNLIGANEPKSQNTMLHVMEAYTNLYRVWPDDGLRRRLVELVDMMITRVLDPQTKHLHLFLAADWAPRSREISYGHDIEFSWLVIEAAEVLGDRALVERLQTLATSIARVTLGEGVAPDGGLYTEGGPNGVTDRSQHWWPQAEATVGFLNAYEISGDETFLRASQRTWDFIEKRIVDRKHGEWFWGRDARGRVIERQPKVGIWKCPYHNGRACLELVERIEKLLGEPAK